MLSDDELPPLPQSFTILSRLQSGTEEVVPLDVVREYGRACERAAYAKAEAWHEPLLKLLELSEISDDCQYGTLSTSVVRDLVNEALGRQHE